MGRWARASGSAQLTTYPQRKGVEMTDGPLEGKVALVTGVTKGIGRASAVSLAKAGVHIVGVARGSSAKRMSSLESLAGEVAEAGVEFVAVKGDVGVEETAREALKMTLARFGRLDLLLNNAGVGKYEDFAECTVSDYDRIMVTNMRSTFLFTAAAVPVMKRQGSGLILQIASQAGLRGFAREAIYCASKHAQVGFTRALRQELQPFGIKVGVICPAGVATDFAIGDGRTNEFVAQAGFLSPQDVADAVLFCMQQSPQSRAPEMSLMSLGENL